MRTTFWPRPVGWSLARYRAGQCRRCAQPRMDASALCVGCDEKARIYRETQRPSTRRVIGRPRGAQSRRAPAPRVVASEPMREPTPFVAHPVRYQVYLAPVGSYARSLLGHVIQAVR